MEGGCCQGTLTNGRYLMGRDVGEGVILTLYFRLFFLCSISYACVILVTIVMCFTSTSGKVVPNVLCPDATMVQHHVHHVRLPDVWTPYYHD